MRQMTRAGSTRARVFPTHRASRTLTVLAGLLFASTLTGCHPSTDPAEFRAAVHSWVPLGTPQNAATEIMQAHGFTTGTRIEPATSTAEADHVLWAQREDPWWFLPIVGWRWQAWFTVENNVVTSIESAVNFSGP